MANNKGVGVSFGDKYFNIYSYYEEVLKFKKGMNAKKINCTKKELRNAIPYDVEVYYLFIFYTTSLLIINRRQLVQSG